jgi:tetratricopeptide (TPR) repeat protein
VAAVVVSAAVVACAPPPQVGPHAVAAVAPPSSSAAATSGAGIAFAAAPGASASAAPVEEHPIVFVEDDYARALAEARARHVPIVVDTWATWCHSCLSMRSYVFPDPSLRRFGARFVWLSIDTERDGNAPLVERLGVKSLPTLYVLDPASEQPVLAWVGSLTAAELAPLLEDAERAATRGDSGGNAGAALLRGHQAAAGGRADEAIAAYQVALAAAPPDWPRRPQAVDALVLRLAKAGQIEACVATASREAHRLPPGTALADVIRQGIDCADDLPKPASPADVAAARARLVDLAVLGDRLASDPATPILADDRSDLFDYVMHAYRSVDRPDDAKRIAKAWAPFLEQEAARAASPSARAVFDAHRLLAYVALGEPQRAVPMLEQSERDFPADYNPPARLAIAYQEMKRTDDALAAVKRALALAYGPRRLTLWAREADLYEAKHDKAGARRALEEALAFARATPLTGGYPRLRDALERRLAKLR